MKLLTQAMVLEAKHHYVDWKQTPITPTILDALDLKHPIQIITVGGLEDRHHGKLSVDILSQKNGVFRSVLSPHYKTGLVSRDITNEFGQIGTQYRIWRFMRYLSEIEQVKKDVLKEPEKMRPRPGLLTRRGITKMAEELSGVVKMIAKFSPARTTELEPFRYNKYRNRYDSGKEEFGSIRV